MNDGYEKDTHQGSQFRTGFLQPGLVGKNQRLLWNVKTRLLLVVKMQRFEYKDLLVFKDMLNCSPSVLVQVQ